jgi:hypothetical protein
MGKKGVPFEMLAYIIAVVINLMIIVSTFAFCFESVKSTSPDPHVNPEDWQYWESVWWTIEVVCVAMFTAELVIRIAAAASTNRLRECLSDPMTWIDAVAIFGGTPFAEIQERGSGSHRHICPQCSSSLRATVLHGAHVCDPFVRCVLRGASGVVLLRTAQWDQVRKLELNEHVSR